MALVLRIRHWRGVSLAFALAILQCLQPGHAAAINRNEPIEIAASTSERKGDTETLSMTDPVVIQGRTLLKALKGERTSPDGENDNSTWKFTGNVHLEFDGAVLDAQAATAVFVNGRLGSVVVMAVAPQLPKKLVHVIFKSAVLDVENATIALAEGRIRTIQAQGAPTQFSYQLKKQGQRVSGHADKIEFDAARDSIRFSGDTRYTDGNNEAATSALTYNFSDGSMATEAMKSIIRPRGERVPAPRTPDRSTAR